MYFKSSDYSGMLPIGLHCGILAVGSKHGVHDSSWPNSLYSWIPHDVTVLSRRHLCVRPQQSGHSVVTETDSPFTLSRYQNTYSRRKIRGKVLKVKMAGICCAVGCDSSRHGNPGLQFYSIPKDVDRRNKRLAAMLNVSL